MLDILKLAQGSHIRGDLAKHLHSIALGRPVHIIGSGPSADDYVYDPSAYVIVTNSAVHKWGHIAHLHVMIEVQVWLFPWSLNQGDFKGKTVMAIDCGGKTLSVDARNAYSDSWWKDALWAKRRLYQNGEDLRELDSGPVQLGGRGGVGSCAVHFGQIANQGGEIHCWGMEFYFPDGKQHYDDLSPYTRSGGITGLVNFDIIDGEPNSGALGRDGPYVSTPFFIASSQGIRKMCRLSGVHLIDHSGGLLDPAKMHVRKDTR